MGDVRQKMKCSTNLGKIVSLFKELRTTKKVDLLSSSVFKNLINLENSRESSGPLSQKLCEVFDGTDFVLNPSTRFRICSNEVSLVLGMENTGSIIDIFELKPCLSPPSYLSAVIVNEVRVSSNTLREHIIDMPIETEEDKVICQKLCTLYIIDQFLCPSTEPKRVNSRYFELADDLEKVNSLNWPQIVLCHIKKALTDSKSALANPGKKRQFNGCSPILDVVVYERIPRIRPLLQKPYSIPLEKYRTQRLDVKNLVKNLEGCTADEILSCDGCQPVPLNIDPAPMLLPPSVEKEESSFMFDDVRKVRVDRINGGGKEGKEAGQEQGKEGRSKTDY